MPARCRAGAGPSIKLVAAGVAGLRALVVALVVLLANGENHTTIAPTVTATSDQGGLAVQREGGGRGRVTSEPPGSACGMRCRAEFPEGSKVVRAAEAFTGSRFAGWSGGGCAGTARASCGRARA